MAKAIFDTVSGEGASGGLFDLQSKSNRAPLLNVYNMSEMPSPMEINNLSMAQGRFLPDLAQGEERLSKIESYDGKTLSFDELDDANAAQSLLTTMPGDKLLRRTLGYVKGIDAVVKTDNFGGTAIEAYDQADIRDLNDELLIKPTTAQIIRYGKVGQILDNIDKTKSDKENAMGSMAEIQSYFYPVYDQDLGWIYQEKIMTPTEAAAMQAAGMSVANKYGNQRMYAGWGKSLATMPLSVAEVLADTPHTMLSLAESGSTILESAYNYAKGDGWKHSQDKFDDYMDILNTQRYGQTTMNTSSIKADSGDWFNSLEWFNSGLGNVAGSLIQFGGLGRLSMSAAKALGATGKVGQATAMFGTGMVLNHGEAYNEARAHGLSKEDSAAMGLTVGAINSLIEVGFGRNLLNKWMIGANGRTGSKEAAKIVVDVTGGNMDKLGDAAVRHTILKRAFDKAKKVFDQPILGSMLEEGSEEVMQNMVLETAQAIYDHNFADDPVFKADPTSSEAWSEAFQEGFFGAIAGGFGGVGVKHNRAKTREDLYAFISRNREQALRDGALHAFNSGAISEDSYGQVSKDIDNIVSLRDNNKPIFQKLLNYDPAYRPKIAERVLSQIGEMSAFIDNNLVSDQTSPQQNQSIEKKLENTDKLELLIKTAMGGVTVESNTKTDGSEKANDIHTPFNTTGPLIQLLDEKGLKKEAKLVKSIQKATTKTTGKLINKINNQFTKRGGQIPAALLDQLSNTLSTTVAETITKRALSNIRIDAANESKNHLIADSGSDAIKLTNLLDNLSEKVNSMVTDAGFKSFDDYIKSLYKPFDDSNDSASNEASLVNGVLAKIKNLVDNTIDNNSDVSNIEDTLLNEYIKYFTTAEKLVAESEIDYITNKEFSKKFVDKFVQDLEKQAEIEENSEKTEDTVEVETPEEESAEEKERKKKEADDQEVVNQSEKTGELDFEFDSGVTAKFNENKDKTFGYTIENGGVTKTVNFPDGTPKDSAIAAYKEAVRKAVTKEGVEEASKGGVSAQPVTEIVDSPDIPETETHTETIEQRSHLRYRPRPIGTARNVSDSERTLYQYINDPLNDMSLFSKNGRFMLSKNVDELAGKNQNRDIAVAKFRALKSLSDFNNLSEADRTLIVEYLPIAYSFGGTNQYTIYFPDKSSSGYGTIYKEQLNGRLRIVQGILESNNGEYAETAIDIRRDSGKYNNLPDRVNNRNSKLTDIKGLHLKQDVDGSYKVAYNHNGAERLVPIAIGVTNNDGNIVASRNDVQIVAGGRDKSAGTVYLIAPSILATDGKPNRPIRLNTTKISDITADSIIEIIEQIGTNKISLTSTIQTNEDAGLDVDGESTMTYMELLEIIIPNGSVTRNYTKLDSPELREYLLDKVFHLNTSTGNLLYGHNPKTNTPYVIDIQNITDEQRSELKAWMTDPKNGKNYSVSANSLGTKLNTTFTVGDIVAKRGTPYETFLIDNGIIKSDLNPTAPSIVKDATVYMNFPNIKKDVVIPISKTPTKPTTVKTEPAQPLHGTTVTGEKGTNLTNDPLKGVNMIRTGSYNKDVVAMLTNVPVGTTMLASLGKSYTEVASLPSRNDKLSKFVDVSHILPDLKAWLAATDLDYIGTVYDVVQEIINKKMGRVSNDTIGIISFVPSTKSTTTDNTETSSTETVETDNNLEARIQRLDERDKRSLDSWDATSETQKNQPVKTGHTWNDGNRVIVRSVTAAPNLVKAESVESELKIVTVYTKIVEPAQFDANGKMTKVATVDAMVFNNESDAKAFIADKINKIKKQSGKKQAELRKQSTEDTTVIDNPVTSVGSEIKKVESELKKTSIEEDFIKSAEAAEKSTSTSALSNTEIDEIMRQIKITGKKGKGGFDPTGLFRKVDVTQISNRRVTPIESEIKQYRKMLGKNLGGDVTVVDKLIEMGERANNPRYAWAVMTTDGVTLYNGAEEGTLYHEAFHRVSQMYLSPIERTKLYNDARLRFGDQHSELTLEELLAEDFRHYMLNDNPTNDSWIKSLWNRFKAFITSFITKSTPNYTTINQLYESIRNGQLRHVTVSQKSIDLFKQRYPNAQVGFEIQGVDMPGFKSAKMFYNTIQTFTNMMINHTGIENLYGRKYKKLDYGIISSYVEWLADNTVDTLSELDSTNKEVFDIQQRMLQDRLLLYRDIQQNMQRVIIPEIEKNLKNIGLVRVDPSEIDTETAKHSLANHKNDEVSLSTMYSAKDTATADIKLLFNTLRVDDGDDADTGFPRYTPYNISWFSAFRLLHDSIDLSDMLDRIHRAGEELKTKHSSVNMYTDLYDKLTRPHVTEDFRTRFWVTLKKHRHRYINTYFRASNDGVMYMMKDADINKRSRSISSQWSTLFALRRLHAPSNMNTVERDNVLGVIGNIKKDYLNLEDRARRSDLGDIQDEISKFIEIMNRLEIGIDHSTMELILGDYKSTLLDDPSASEDDVIKDKFRSFLLDVNNIDGKQFYMSRFFNETLTDGELGIIGKASRLNKKTNREELPEKYLQSQSFVPYFAEKFITANPTIEDDSIIGPDGNNRYAFSEYNYLTQTFEDYLKRPDFIDSLLSVNVNESSQWLRQIKENEISTKNVKVETMLSFLQLDTSDKGREYKSISDVEDVMMRFTASMAGKFAPPTPVNKRTYHFISGFNQQPVILERSRGTNNLKPDASTVKVFADYAKSEYKAIQAAKKARQIVLDRVKEHGKDTAERIAYFNSLSSKEQKEIGYSELRENYHFKRTGDNIALDGNGYKFRHFGRFDSLGDAKLKKLFETNDYTELNTYVEQDIINEINDTITFMDELGIIQLDGRISSKTKSIGTNNAGEIVISSARLFDKSDIAKYAKNLGLQVDRYGYDRTATLNMIADFTVNTMISTIEFEKIVAMDPAFFKNPDDKLKRLSAHSSTGIVQRTEYGNATELYGVPVDKLRTYNSAIIDTNLITDNVVYDNLLDKYVNELGMDKSVAEEKLKNYKEVDQTDAQVYVTPDMFKKIGINIGEWSDIVDDAFNKLVSDKVLTPEEELQAYQDVSIHIRKMVYVAPQFENGLGIPIYDKMSLAPLFKRFTKGRKLDHILDAMESADIQMLKFNSAVKSGGHQAVRFYDSDGIMNKDFADNLKDLKYRETQQFEFLRQQLNTDPHLEDSIAAGTQMVKIAISNVTPDAIYSFNNEDIVGEDLVALNTKLINELTKRGFNDYLKEFGHDGKNISKKSFADTIRKRAESSGLPDSLIRAFDITTDKYKVEPSVVPSINWIESSLLSMLKSKVIDINLHGGAYIQMSNFGFDDESIIEANKQNYRTNKSLRFRDEDGFHETAVSMSMIAHMLPEVTETIDGVTTSRPMTYEEARDVVRNSDLRVIGYRIPTQGQNSTLALRIVDIMPPEMGDVVVLPAEFTALTGADFDVDKLFIVTPKFKYSGVSQSLIRTRGYKTIESLLENITDSKKVSKEEIQNALIDSFLSVLTSEHHLVETTTPLDATTAPVKEVAKKLLGNRADGQNRRNLSMTTPRFQNMVKSQNMGADDGIGPMALANVHQHFTQISGTGLNPDIKMDGANNIVKYFGIGDLSKKYDNDGILIQDWTSALINAHVDAAKDPYILLLNVNKYTYPTTALLIRSGFGLSTFYFLPQPILKDLSSEYARLKSGKLGLSRDELRRYNWEADVINDWTNKYLKLAAKEGYTPTYSWDSEELMNSLTNIDELQTLLDTTEENRTADWYYKQLAIGKAYLQLAQYGKALTNLIKHTQIDTAKYGKNGTAIQIFSRGIDKILKNESGIYTNPEYIFDKTFLGVKKEYSIDKFFDLFKNEIMELSDGFLDLTNSILSDIERTYIDDSMVNTINRELRTQITSEFFNKYISEQGIDLNEMFFGERSTVAKFEALRKTIESNPLLRTLRDNEVFEFLTANSVDYTQSKAEGKPQMFNASVFKSREANALNVYQYAFTDLLYHPVEAVRDLANELIVYAYYTSGGTSGGLNNFINIIPEIDLANVSLKDGTTYNDFVRSKVNYLNSGMMSNESIGKLKRDVFRSLWNNRDIVPVVGEYAVSDTGWKQISTRGFVSKAQSSYSITENGEKIKSGVTTSAHIVMNEVFANLYGKKLAEGVYNFVPFITVENKLNKNEKILYEYAGYLKNEVGSDSDPIIKPVYRLAPKLGINQDGNTIKESGEYSFIGSNNTENTSKLDSRIRFGKTSVRSKNEVFYPVNQKLYESVIDWQKENKRIADATFLNDIMNPEYEAPTSTFRSDTVGFMQFDHSVEALQSGKIKMTVKSPKYHDAFYKGDGLYKIPNDQYIQLEHLGSFRKVDNQIISLDAKTTYGLDEFAELNGANSWESYSKDARYSGISLVQGKDVHLYSITPDAVRSDENTQVDETVSSVDKLIKNAQTLIIDYGSSNIENSDVFAMQAEFSKLNKASMMSAESIQDAIKSTNSSVQLIKPPMPNSKKDLPISIVRDESAQSKIEPNLDAHIKRLSNWGFRFQVRNNDSALVSYMKENEINHEVLGESQQVKQEVTPTVKMSVEERVASIIESVSGLITDEAKLSEIINLLENAKTHEQIAKIIEDKIC